MNCELLDSFGQNYPEEFDGSLDCSSIALTSSFNRWGSLLAVGCNDGKVVVIDFVTRGISKIISAHVHPVCSVSWSRNGRSLLTASTDNTVAVWEVLTGECVHRYRFPSPVLKVQFHPRNAKIFIVCPLKHASVLVQTGGAHEIIPADDELGVDLNVTASFDKRGNHIFTGNGKGKISIFKTDTLQLVSSYRLPSNHAVKSIVFARKGDFFLTNSADRIIRVYNAKSALSLTGAKDLEPIQKLQDLVNKTPWKACCFSGDGEYVCAGSAKQHALYIWERNSNSLVKILPGTKGETLLDVVWHPGRPIVCSVSNGIVSIWAQSHVENWSAFAPDFKELDENVEYEERESEFDLEDEDRSVELNDDKKPIEDFEVDVTTVEPPACFVSSDEEGDDPENLWFLPVAPEIDDPEEKPDQMFPGDIQDFELTKKQQKTKFHDIELEHAPADEVHPLLLVGGSRRRTAGNSGGGRVTSKQRKKD